MAEAQEKRLRLLDRVSDIVGGPFLMRPSPFDSLTLHVDEVEALLDKLDEAKAERDEAIDDRASALSEQARAERDRDEARAEVVRLRQAVNDFLGDIGMLQEADGIGREFLTNPDKVRDRLSEVARRWKHDEDMGGQALEHVEKLEAAVKWLRGELAAASKAAETRVAELEAEVERLRKERIDAERTTVDEAQAANKAIGRVAELEDAAREAVWCWFSDGLRPVSCAMHRMRDLVGDPDFEIREDAPLPEPEDPGGQPAPDFAALIRDLDRRVTGDLNELIRRLARVEVRNG